MNREAIDVPLATIPVGRKNKVVIPGNIRCFRISTKEQFMHRGVKTARGSLAAAGCTPAKLTTNAALAQDSDSTRFEPSSFPSTRFPRCSPPARDPL